MNKGRDFRVKAALAVVLAVAAGGWMLDRIPGRQAEAPLPTGGRHVQEGQLDTVEERFAQGVAMLHLKGYEYALAAFDRVIDLSPGLVEAHVNRGYSLAGLEQFADACRSFETAIDLRPEQVNAYYGLGICLEALGDLPGAMGAMRTYLHLAPPDQAETEHQRRAAAALWEWESALADDDTPDQREGGS